MAVRLRRRHGLIAAGLAVLLIAGVAFWVAARPDGFRTEDRMLTVQTGPAGNERVRLDTRLYVPDAATSRAKAPAVLLAHGFGGTKDSVRDDAEDLAGRGYVVLTWTAQGFGRSTGTIHLNSPDYEVTDARRLLDWLATRPEVQLDGADDPRVGVAGGSYGGGLALLLAGYDQRVDAIVPQITWNDLDRALFPGGVFKRAWAGSLFTAGLAPGPGATPQCGRFAPDVCRTYLQSAATGRSDAQTKALLTRSSPRTVLDRIEAPTLLVQGLADSLFPLDEADANARGIAATGTPVQVAWFSGGHDGGQGSTADQDRLKYLTITWFDHYLKGIGPSSTDFTFSRVNGYDYRTSSVRTTALSSARYPGLEGNTEPRSLQLTGRPSPIANPPNGVPAPLTNFPSLGAFAQASEAAGALADIPGQFVRYESPTLDEATDIAGAATVQLLAASPTKEAVLFVKLYDVGSNGSQTLLGGQVAPIRLTGLPTSLDQAKPVTVQLPGIVHRWSAGHRIRVTIATADQAYASPPAPTTYVVGLAEGRLTLPQVTANPIATASAVWPWILAAVLLAIALGVALAWLVARTRTRRRTRTIETEATDIPLVIRGLAKTYTDGFQALKGIDFEVGRGQVVGLLGPNGAGKTTCLRILLGLIRPTAGEVLIFGNPLTPSSDVLNRLGALVEGPGFLPHLSGRKNLELYWRATGRPKAEARLDEVLEIAALGSALERKVKTYSHGMKQRLAVAQAMLGMPELLVLDEPTDGLDPPQIAEMRRVLKGYAANGRAVLVSSHLLAEVEQACTHVVVLDRGRRVAAGSVGEIVGTSNGQRLEDVFLSLIGGEAR